MIMGLLVIGVNQNKKNQKGTAAGGHNRAEARARSSGEIAGRAFGRPRPPLTARNGSEPYCGERGRSEREALPTPYSRSDGVRPAAETPWAHTVERREAAVAAGRRWLETIQVNVCGVARRRTVNGFQRAYLQLKYGKKFLL